MISTYCIETKGSSAIGASDGRRIIFYTRPDIAWRKDIKLASVQDEETLVGYLKRFGRIIREVFSKCKTGPNGCVY